VQTFLQMGLDLLKSLILLRMLAALSQNLLNLLNLLRMLAALSQNLEVQNALVQLAIPVRMTRSDLQCQK